MRPHSGKGALAMLSAAALIAAGCGSDSKGSSATTSVATTSTVAQPTTTGSAAASVNVTKDITYSAPTDGTAAQQLDVYAPKGAAEAPLVVLLHGGGENRTGLQYPQLATAMAEKGAVVVVPTWGGGRPEPALPVASATATLAAAVNDARCAVEFAVSHAQQWGASGAKVTLVGHSAGANVASVLVFSATTAATGCLASSPGWKPAGAVLWEGDMAMIDPSLWDQYGKGLVDLMALWTPWSMLKSGFTGPVTFMVTTNSRSAMKRCDDIAAWAPMRDSSGTVEAALKSVNTTSKDCYDVGKESLALGAQMTKSGVKNDYVEFADAANHTYLTPDDRATLVDRAWAIATS